LPAHGSGPVTYKAIVLERQGIRLGEWHAVAKWVVVVNLREGDRLCWIRDVLDGDPFIAAVVVRRDETALSIHRKIQRIIDSADIDDCGRLATTSASRALRYLQCPLHKNCTRSLLSSTHVRAGNPGAQSNVDSAGFESNESGDGCPLGAVNCNMEDVEGQCRRLIETDLRTSPTMQVSATLTEPNACGSGPTGGGNVAPETSHRIGLAGW